MSPYCLSGGYCQSVLSISSTAGTAAGGVTLSGTANGSAANQNVVVRAAVCNTIGEYVTKSMALNTGSKNTAQGWSLYWGSEELPVGTYTGTIWVDEIAGGEWLAAAESGAVNFIISPRTIDLSVVRGRAFDLVLGDAGAFNLTSGTNNGVTVSIDNGTNVLRVSGTLTADTALTFGSSILNFTTFDIPTSVVINDSLN